MIRVDSGRWKLVTMASTTELVTREDEDVGVAENGASGLPRARVTLAALERTYRGGPHRNHPAAAGTGRRDGVHHLLRHFGVFRVHVVIFNLVHPYRLEGARPHVQGDEGRFHALGTNFLQQRLVEVQAGGRRRHGARLLVVDGLVALLVGILVGTIDIGGSGMWPMASVISSTGRGSRKWISNRAS